MFGYVGTVYMSGDAMVVAQRNGARFLRRYCLWTILGASET